MSTENHPRQSDDLWMEALVILVGVLVAWPAVLIGAVAHVVVKQRAPDPFPYWVGAGVLGSVGAWFLYAHANPYPLLVTVLRDIVPLALHLSGGTLRHFVEDALPLWERSVLLFPWLTLLIEIFAPKNLQASLLALERRRRAIQAKKSRRAAHKATRAPDQIHGHAILGALIENPNE
jgi:hypothetical protein